MNFYIIYEWFKKFYVNKLRIESNVNNVSIREKKENSRVYVFFFFSISF